MPNVLCKVCSKEFTVKPNRILRGWGSYCSRICSYKGKIRGKIFACMTCAKQLLRTPGQVLKSKDGNFFCNKTCFMIWKNQHLLIGEKHGNWKGGHAAYRGIMFRAKIVPVCGECEIKDLRVLVVHHIDHNRSNNTLPNLQWLCRNCHYLAHNGKTF